MTSTEAPFRATLPIEVMGHKVLLTSGHDDGEQFLEQWAFLAEQMPIFVEILKRAVAGANAQQVAAAVPAQVVPTPAPAAPAVPSSDWGSWQQPAAQPQAADPWGAPAVQETPPVCDHGQPMRKVPAGISKKTGAPYRGFWACAGPIDQQCKKKVYV